MDLNFGAANYSIAHILAKFPREYDRVAATVMTMALATDAVSVALAYLPLPNDDGSVVVARDERLALPAFRVRTLTG